MKGHTVTSSEDLEVGAIMAKGPARIVAWWRLVKPIWLLLGAGYLWVLFSFCSGFNSGSSGAMLVVAVLVAELILDSLGWVGKVSSMLNGAINPQLLRVNVTLINQGQSDELYGYLLDEGTQCRAMGRGSTESLIHFQQVVSPDEFDGFHHYKKIRNGKPIHWAIWKTERRVNRTIKIVFALSLILGTFIWAYVSN